MTVACIGDLHLGKLDHLRSNFSALQLKTLKVTLREIVENGIGSVVFLGDIFDIPDPPQQLVVRLLKLLRTFELDYYIILGNHDKLSIEYHSCEFFEALANAKFLNARVISKPEIIKVEGLKAWFCPHPYTEDVPKGVTVGFGHFPWTGAKRDNGSVEQHGYNPKGNWVLGDFHGPQDGKRHTYAGSLTQLTFGEKADKRYLIVDGDGNIQSRKVDVQYVLNSAIVSSTEELDLLDTKVFWSVAWGKNYTPPADWSSKYPHILRHAFTSKKDSKKEHYSSFILSNPLASLKDWLKARKNLKEDRVTRAMKVARSLGTR